MMNAAALAVLLLVPALPAPGVKYTLTAGPVEEDIANALLEAEIAAPEGGSIPVLVEAASGKRVPCRLTVLAAAGEGKRSAKVAWIAPLLRKGETGKWALSFADAETLELKRDFVQLVRGSEHSIAVEIGGEPFTAHIARPGEHKPYLYPILLDGLDLTRHFPMKKIPRESTDHPHQRSFWFTHGDVNGVDFWSEGGKAGRIVLTGESPVESAAVFAALKTRAAWQTPDGEKLLDDAREYRFIALADGARAIDLTITLTASAGPVTFGDTKEGTFGIRLRESLKEASGGRMENSRGAVGERNVWGKPAEWIDYTGEIDGKTYGVAILDHPTSFRHPTHWHSRGYGLFAANPFGYRDFYRDRSKDGSYKLGKGESITFRYRTIFHRGATDAAQIAASWRGFAHPPAVKVAAGVID